MFGFLDDIVSTVGSTFRAPFDLAKGIITPIGGGIGQIFGAGAGLVDKAGDRLGRIADVGINTADSLGKLVSSPIFLLAGGALVLVILLKK